MSILSKIVFGLMIMTVATTFITANFNSQLKVSVDMDKTTFRLFKNNSWIVGGIEYNKLFNGTKNVYRIPLGVRLSHFNDSEVFTIMRETDFQNGALIRDIYSFYKNSSNKE